MSNIQSEIASKEHNGDNTTKGKRIFAYGWDYDNLKPVKVRCDSNGVVQVTNE